jgi:regulator of sigma E protease
MFYILLAILGLGFLVFIHELGHYFVARRKGMRVEAFAIGFGKPIFTWERDGVKWHICMLPFGGYVKIAGMQREGSLEPYEIQGGFYGKKPMDRIWVALAGPLVNIAFALLVFTVLWMAGGRDKPFFDFTHRIGWVDPHSALYANGVRPGDLIEKYDGKPFTGIKDLLVSSLMKGETTRIEGVKIDYLNGRKSHFDYTLKTYPSPELMGKEKLNTIGVLSPASYLIYQGPNLVLGSPMQGSGIEPKDRILWADGEVIFSHQQLSSLTNEPSAFLTVKRGSQIFQTKVPRIKLADLKMTLPEKGEIDDWQHEAALKGPLTELYFIPYNLSPTLDVESKLRFIEESDQKKAFAVCERCPYFTLMEEGDQIIAVDGTPVHSPHELLAGLQTRKMLVIVDRDPKIGEKVLWTKADEEFDGFSSKDLQMIVSSIGTDHQINDVGDLHLLKAVVPKPLSELSKAALDEKAGGRLVLGVPLSDREVRYNPTPFMQFNEVIRDTYYTLKSLFSGAANPKYVAGPVGIVQIVHHSWMLGVKEALFWMALISLNLGIINLLPLPVLDGGHILFSIVEAITKRPLKSRTMEKLIIPFVVLIIGFFIFVTYHDITRLFSKFF